MSDATKDIVGGALGDASVHKLTDKSLFLGLIVVCTVFPLLFVPLAAPLRSETKSIGDIFQLLVLMSTMHVGLTAYFYFDREYRAFAASHWKYYILFPASVVLGAGLITATFVESGAIYLQILYHAWLLFHYGRQNYGVLAFAASATGSGRPSINERMALHLVPIGGILGAHAVFGNFKASVFAPYVDLSVSVGIALTVLGVAFAIIEAARQMMRGVSLWRPCILILTSLFYLPTFLFHTYFQAVMGYAIAHALQYFVFMYFLAAGTQKQGQTRSVIVLIFAMLMTWGLILLTRERSLWGAAESFVVGAATGIVMWHFILDAGFWKLSQPWQRQQVKERFAFLFDSATTTRNIS